MRRRTLREAAAVAALLVATGIVGVPAVAALWMAPCGDGQSLWVEGRIAAGYDRNAFFISSMRNFYPADIAVQLTLEQRIVGGLRIEIQGTGELRRDVASVAGEHSLWNDVAWLNHSAVGGGARLVWSARSVPQLGRWPVFKNGELQLTVQMMRIRYATNAVSVGGCGTPNNLQLGGVAWAEFEWFRRPRSGGSIFRRFTCDVIADVGLGARYDRVDPFVPEYQGFYIVDGVLHVLSDPVWPRQETLALGPSLQVRFSTDLGKRFWNRFDWRNNVTLGFGIECRAEVFGARVGWSGQYQVRYFWDRVSYVPPFRPTQDVVVRLSIGKRVTVLG